MRNTFYRNMLCAYQWFESSIQCNGICWDFFYRLFSLFRSYYMMFIALMLYSLCAYYAYNMHNYEQIHWSSDSMLRKRFKKRNLLLISLDRFYGSNLLFLYYDENEFIYAISLFRDTHIRPKIICKGNKNVHRLRFNVPN